MTYCLDTNAYSNWRRFGWYGDLIAHAEVIWISAFVIGELLEGFERSALRETNERRLREFLRHPVVKTCPVSDTTAAIYASFKNQLRTQGTPIPENDVWIAACASETRSILLTRDKHFGNLPQVRVIIDGDR